jgi:putative copper resistance protein D
LIGLRALIAWPVLVAQLVIFGTAAFALTLGRDARGERDHFIRGLIWPWQGLALLNLLISPLLLLEITAGMAQTGWREALPLIPEVLQQTHAGQVWEWRLPFTGLLVITSLSPMRHTATAWSLLIVSSALFLLESLTSHAVDIGRLAIAIYFIHQCAAALWLGAVLGLWIGVRRAKLDVSWVEYAAPWVSRLAGWTVLILIMSGVLTAYHALAGDPSHILSAAYGRALSVKLAAASLVLMIGAYNRFLLIPQLGGTGARDRLLRNVGLESVLLAGVIGLAAVLANTPPAH